MTLMRPDKPCRVRGMRGSMVINSMDWGTSNSGMAVPSVGSTESAVPCRLDVVSPGEAFKNGHTTGETVYRLYFPVRAPDGSDIRLGHNQTVVVTDPHFPTGETMVVNGDSQPQGSSGMQTATVKVEGR